MLSFNCGTSAELVSDFVTKYLTESFAATRRGCLSLINSPPAVVKHELKVSQGFIGGGVLVLLDLFVNGFHVHGLGNHFVIVGVIFLARLLNKHANQLDAIFIAIPATNLSNASNQCISTFW